MPDQELSPELRRFIGQHLDSVESIEILLLLRRSPDTYWAAEATAGQLSIRLPNAAAKLDALSRSGLLAMGGQTGAYRYAPRTEELRSAVDLLADAYANRPVSIINTIYSGNREKLRAFSDAFRMK